MKKVFASIVCAVFLWGFSGDCRAADSSDNPIKDDLENVGENLKRERRLLKRLQSESSSLLQALDQIDSKKQSAEKELEDTRSSAEQLELELVELRRRKRLAARSLDDVRVSLRTRLRRLYKMGDLGWLNLVLGAKTISDGLQRVRLMERLAQADKHLMEETIRFRDQLAISEREIAERKVKLEELTLQVRERHNQVVAVREEQLRALRLVRKKKGLHQKAMSELKRARKRLGRLMTQISKGGAAGRGFASWRGRLPHPVENGRVDVPFGRQVDERFKTVTMHKGIDISAKRGSPIIAVYPGNVVFSDVFRGYGLLVILEHGGGFFTLYGHLDRILVSKGDKVGQAQQVGTLGQTGSLKGSFLYFEVRQGGRAVDPIWWLKKFNR